VTKLVRAGEALHGERSLCRDQDTRLLSRDVRAEQLVELLEHERRTELSDGAEHVDAATAAAFEWLADAEIAMQRVCGLAAI